jgi:signal transduction histidine kinase
MSIKRTLQHCGPLMSEKPLHRSLSLGLPRWAGASLGLYLVFMAVHLVVGPRLHLLPVYLIPVLLASRGGIAPGLAMTAAVLLSYAAIETLVLSGAVPATVLTDGLLFLALAATLVTRVAATYQRLDRCRREVESAGELLRFARHAGNPTDLPLLLRAVADAGSQLLRAEYGATFLWDAHQKLFRAAQQSARADDAGIRVTSLALPAAGSPVVAQLLRERKALTSLDAGAELEWARLLRGLPIARAMLVPARSWGRVLGCLLFGRSRTGPPFSERDCRLAEAMAEHVAAALEHAEAFRAVERQADQIRQLNHDLERQNARLTELEQLRNDLVHMIVHDMRAPLTAIIAAMRWIERDAGTGLSAPLAEANRVGRRSAEELLGMVNDLLDVARIEEGHGELERQVASVDELLAAALEQTRYLARDRRLTIESEIPPALPAVFVDRDKIVRVLVNLVGNAIKFTPSAGLITISARSESAGWVAVSVSDTGEGIPPEYHQRIFDKFGQVKTRQGGRTMSTGLGLAFCRLAVEAHGGRIGVRSEPGHGATFTFTLPASLAPAATDQGEVAGAGDRERSDRPDGSPASAA